MRPIHASKPSSEPVARVDDEIRQLIDDMLESMYAADGIGLAAIQVGVPKRVLVMDLAQQEGRREPLTFINPKILWASEEPPPSRKAAFRCRTSGTTSSGRRASRAEFMDRDGSRTLDADGLLATCLQHEMDHLDGMLFIDHLSKLKRSIALRKVQKAKRLEQATEARRAVTLRLAFLGTPDFAVPTLSELIGQGHDIAAVYTQPRATRGPRARGETRAVAKLRAAHGLRCAHRRR